MQKGVVLPPNISVNFHKDKSSPKEVSHIDANGLVKALTYEVNSEISTPKERKYKSFNASITKY